MTELTILTFCAVLYSLYAADIYRGDEAYDDPVGRACLRFWRRLGVFR